MTFFFYGGIDDRGDEAESRQRLARLAAASGLELEIGAEIGGCPAERLLAATGRFLLFRLLAPPEAEAYDAFYAGYGGEEMVVHYRRVARQLGVEGAERLEFGAREDVNAAYSERWADLPGLRFIESVLQSFPDHRVVFCLDEGFDNGSRCSEVAGSDVEILVAAWRSIAFGYTWPGLRLRHEPTGAPP